MALTLARTPPRLAPPAPLLRPAAESGVAGLCEAIEGDVATGLMTLLEVLPDELAILTAPDEEEQAPVSRQRLPATLSNFRTPRRYKQQVRNGC